MEKRVDKLEESMSDVRVRLAVTESGLEQVRDDIGSIKDDTRWLRRTVTGAMVTGLIGGVISLLFIF